jgi:peroxiredoxin Q/BCP
MVRCERCHHDFVSYAALSQHFDAKHHGASKPPELAKQLAAEKELEGYKANNSYAHGPSKTKSIAFVLILIIAASIIGYVALTPKEAAGPAVGVSSVAPDFTLRATNGTTFTLFAYRGKSNVLLLFNEGLSCQPCLQQMHDLDGLNSQFSGMNVLVVSITPDNLGQLQNWASSYGPQYGLVLSDANQVAFNLYHPVGSGGTMMTHTFILVNKSGAIVWRQDYGPGTMYVENSEIMADVKNALGA